MSPFSALLASGKTKRQISMKKLDTAKWEINWPYLDKILGIKRNRKT